MYLRRLHGTWLPPSLTRRQRLLPKTLPDQPLLQDKLETSRLRHLASILFSRPAHREKSAFEKTFLAIFIPASIGITILAVWEVASQNGNGHTASVPLGLDQLAVNHTVNPWKTNPDGLTGAYWPLVGVKHLTQIR